MLDSISWQEFFTTVALVAGGYYVMTFLLLYSNEITDIFKQKKSNLSTAEVKSNQLDSNESNDLMGGVRYENREEQYVPREDVASTEELHFASDDSGEEVIQAVDLIEEQHENEFKKALDEINSLIEVVSQGSKDESIPLFKTLLANYPQLIGTDYQERASQHILHACNETCQFHFEISEINSWWTEDVLASGDNE